MAFCFPLCRSDGVNDAGRHDVLAQRLFRRLFRSTRQAEGTEISIVLSFLGTVNAVSGAELRDEDLVDQWHSVTSGVKWVERRVDRVLDDFGVSAQSFGVLHALLRAEEHRSPMNVLAREVSMTSGGFTKLADRMAREGLIDRRSSVADRRVVHAMLTAEGLAAAKQATRLYQDALRECLLSAVSAQDLASAAATMRALRVDNGPVEDAAEMLATERSTALPDRRARSRSQE